jgi:site-specific recombinase XerD
MQKTCNVPMMKKLFKAPKITHWDIIEKETVDEVIFRTMKPRNRLMLELLARGGMRIGEVLKLTLSGEITGFLRGGFFTAISINHNLTGPSIFN